MLARGKFGQARARPGSTMKARARLGLEKIGLVPPLLRIVTIVSICYEFLSNENCTQ